MGRSGGCGESHADDSDENLPADGRAVTSQPLGSHGSSTPPAVESARPIDTSAINARVPHARTPESSAPDASSSGISPSDVSRAGAGQPPSGQVLRTSEPAPRPAGLIERLVVVASGARQPIVAILLLISFFTLISGKPVDGMLLFTIACALAWDAGLRGRARHSTGSPAGDAAKSQDIQPSVWRLRTRPPSARVVAIGSAAAMIYAMTVGSFTRYSWPATAGVVGLGAGVVIVGWGGPIRQREIPGKFAASAVLPWAGLLIVGGLWELAALLGQPDVETGSYAHPTISTLTDPLLASMPGRSVVLLGWIALGFFLVER